MSDIMIVVGTLLAVGAGFGIFRLGRWYEQRRLAGLIDWALSLAQELNAEMTLLEAAEHVGSPGEEPEGARVH